MSDAPPKQYFGETRRGGTVRRRKTVDGKHADIYQAICDECNALGPEAAGATRARGAARAIGWFCERKRIYGRTMESRSFKVLCVSHKPDSSA